MLLRGFTLRLECYRLLLACVEIEWRVQRRQNIGTDSGWPSCRVRCYFWRRKFGELRLANVEVLFTLLRCHAAKELLLLCSLLDIPLVIFLSLCDRQILDYFGIDNISRTVVL